MSDSGDDDDIKVINRKARDEAIGCGCITFFSALILPVLTNWVGITAWPVPVACAVSLVAVLYFQRLAGAIHWNNQIALSLIGLVFSVFAAIAISSSSITQDNDATSTENDAQQSVGEEKQIPDIQKKDVRLSVDDVQNMFADNQIAGQQYFEKHTAIISGRAVRVREALGTGILIIQSNDSEAEMELAFTEAGTKKLGTIRPGEKVDASCPEVREMMSIVIVACNDITVVEGRN